MRASRGIASSASRSHFVRAVTGGKASTALAATAGRTARRGTWTKPETAHLLPPIKFKGIIVMPVIGYKTKGALSVYVDIATGNRLIDENLNVLTDENGDTLTW